MAEVSVKKSEFSNLKRMQAVLICISVGLVASIINVYLQFILNEFFSIGSPLFIRVYEDGFDDMFASLLYFACGLSCFGIFFFLNRTAYKYLSPIVVSAILTITYAYLAHFWLFHWRLGFEHWTHIAMLDVHYVIASTIYPVCMAVMFGLTVFLAKIIQKTNKIVITEPQSPLRLTGIFLLASFALSFAIWFNFYGTFGPIFKPPSPFSAHQSPE